MRRKLNFVISQCELGMIQTKIIPMQIKDQCQRPRREVKILLCI